MNGIVDDRREEVDGLHQRAVVVEPVHTGIVRGPIVDQDPVVVLHGQIAQHLGELTSGELARSTGAGGVVGQLLHRLLRYVRLSVEQFEQTAAARLPIGEVDLDLSRLCAFGRCGRGCRARSGGVPRRRGCGRPSPAAAFSIEGRSRLLDQRFGFAHREVLRTTTRGEAQLRGFVGKPRSARACPIDSAPRADVVAHLLGQLQQPQVVGDRRAVLATASAICSWVRWKSSVRRR